MRTHPVSGLAAMTVAGALALSAALTIVTSAIQPAAATSPVVVSRIVQSSEGKGYLEVDGRPFMVGHVQNAGTLELGNTGGTAVTPQQLAWMENLFEKTKDIGYDTASVILRWRDWETTTRGVYDWTVVDKYIEYAEKYDLRLDFAYFGSNSCGGTRLLGHAEGSRTFVPDYLQDRAKYFGNGLYVGVNHMPWLPDGGPHDADARFMMNSEVDAVRALFDHLAIRDTTHRTILFQAQNEPDWHGKYNTNQKQLIWNWMNAIGNAVKSSNYVVATRVNAGGNMLFQDFQSISRLSGIDAVGNDAYTNDVKQLANVISNPSALGGTPLPHIAENDGNYSNHTSLQVTSLVNGGYYDVWELDSNNGQAMYAGDYTAWTVGTPGAMKPGTTRMSYLLPALSKISALVAAAPRYKMAGYNIDTNSPVAGYNATKTVFNHQVGYAGNDVAMALSSGNSIYAVSDSATSATFKVHQQPISATAGHQDQSGAWIADATKTVTNNGDGTFSVTAAPREAVRIELPAATGTVPPAPTPAPYSNAMNVAPLGTATASSTYNANYAPAKVTDGIIDRYDYGLWSSSILNPSVKLEWATPQRLDKIVLFDRPETSTNANSGTLTFSDGSTIAVTGIDPGGSAKAITFPEKNVTSVEFQVTGGSGSNVGLSEIQSFLSSTAPRPSTLTNISAEATATASSEFSSGYSAAHAIDGIAQQGGSGAEWASFHELNPWIQLDWPNSRTLNKITLYDRPTTAGWAPGGTLTFSDGSSVAVSGIANNGTPRSISFSEKNVNWVRFQVAGGAGDNVGLSELKVFSSGVTPAAAVGNVAPASTVSASSQYNTNYAAGKATDGIIGQDATGEWASYNELNPWIQLTWPTAQTVSQVALYDRRHAGADANSGTLTFSDGSTLAVTDIPTNGASPKIVTFPSRSTTSLRFQVTGGTGSNVGLSEIQVVPTAPPSSYLPTMPDVGWWKFDETRGSTSYGSASAYYSNVFDWHNATMTNAANTAGKRDNALTLDGTSGYALIDGLASYSLPNDTVTYSTWVKAGTTPSGRSIVQNQGGSTTGQIGITVNSNGQLAASVTQTNGTVVSTQDTTAFPTGTWQHVAVVADGTNVRLYRNGTQVATVAYNGTLKTGFTAIGVGVKPNAAGNAPDPTNPGYWNGQIDDLRIYANALNDSEINGLANQP